MEAKKSFNIVPFGGDASQLKEVYEAAFQKKFDLSEYKKKLQPAIKSIPFLGYIAYAEDGSVASFYGLYLSRVQYNEKSYIIGQVADTMTHPRFAGKGLFSELGRNTLEYCKENNIHALYAFPNEKSYPGFVNKLEWQHTDNILSIIVRVYTLPWIRLKSTFRVPSLIHLVWCSFITKWLKKGKNHFSKTREMDQLFVEHDSEFVQYKSYTCTKIVQIYGVNVWLKFSDEFLLIGDMESVDPQLMTKIIKRLKIIAFLCGLPHVRFQGSSDSALINLASNHGQNLGTTYPIVTKNLSWELPIELVKFTLADNDTF